MRTSLTFLAAWAMTMSSLVAQDAAPPKPRSPVVHRAPALASWTIQFQYKSDDKAAAAGQQTAYAGDRAASVTVTKTGVTYREQVTMTSGQTYEKWVFDNLQFRTVPDSQAIIPIPAPTANQPDPNYSDYSKTDFPGLEWVASGNWKQTEVFQGIQVFRFEAGKIALLSVEKQLPAQASDEVATRTYTFNPPPTASLVPPKRILEVVKAHKKAMEALTRPPSPP